MTRDDAFRILTPELADRLIFCMALIALLWALPDLFAWAQGHAPVETCK